MDFEKVVIRLRAEDPWNRRQTADSLMAALRREVDELEDAVTSGNVVAIKDELGDVLFNAVSLIDVYRSVGAFTVREVDLWVADRMVRRHPYVFGDTPDPGEADGVELWNGIEMVESQQTTSRTAGVDVVAILTGGSDGAFADSTRLRTALGSLHGFDTLRDEAFQTFRDGSGALAGLGATAWPYFSVLQVHQAGNIAILHSFLPSGSLESTRRDLTTLFQTADLRLFVMPRDISGARSDVA